MNRTTTRIVDYQKLLDRGKGAAVVVRIMMACNDLQLANEALSSWKEDQPSGRKHRQTGARMYFVRLQMAHLYEAMKIIEKIKADPDLYRMVSECDKQTQESFRYLEEFLAGGSKRSQLNDIMGRVRQNLTFHYEESGRLVERAIADKAGRPDARYSSITRGSTAYLWNFQVADEIIDSIVVRQVMNIPRDADLRTEVDRRLDDMHKIFLAFVDFSGEFVWRFCGA